MVKARDDDARDLQRGHHRGPATRHEILYQQHPRPEPFSAWDEGWFRVAVVTSAGQSGWSDPAVKMAP